MSRLSNKPEPTQLVAIARKDMREGVAVLVTGSTGDWRVELRSVLTPPGEPISLQPNAFALEPRMLREIGATLLGIADVNEIPLTDLPPPEEVEQDVAEAPAHLKELLRAVGTGRASFLVACPGGLPFRSIASHPVVLFVDDAAARGPADFNVDALTMALRRSSLVVVAVHWRIIDHYNAAALKVSEGRSVVIVETKPEQARAWSMFLAAEVPDIEILMPSPEAKAEGSGSLH